MSKNYYHSEEVTNEEVRDDILVEDGSVNEALPTDTANPEEIADNDVRDTILQQYPPPNILQQQDILNANNTLSRYSRPGITPHTAKKPGSTYERYTPPQYLEAARQVMGGIDLDPASCEIANQNVKATKFYTEEENGLTKEWRGNIWLNPPYSIVESFVDKLIESDFKQAIVLTHNCTETKWFCKLVDRADGIVFPNHRINFLNSDGTAPSGYPPRGQTFFYFGDKVADFLDTFKQFGWGTKL